jgi:hypothetical protein
MYAMEQQAADQAFRVVQATAVAMLVGWIVERALDTGLRVRGLGLLAGLVGLYAGAWIWAYGGWGHGPMFGDLALAPTIAGAFAVCGFLKLVGLGLAGPRW